MKLSYLAPATKQKLKICVISTTILHCPPKGYSGLEMIAWQVAEGLKSKGHNVTLVAPRGSQTSCELHETTLGEPERLAFAGGYAPKLPQFDVIIDHSWEKWSYVMKSQNQLAAPILGVLHAPVETMYQSPPPVPFPCLVCISKDQGTNAKEHLKCDNRVAYNGVDVNFYSDKMNQRNNRYLFLARISTIKGPQIAVDVASNCHVGLDLVGDDRITGEPDLLTYIKQKCVMSPYLRYVGHQNRDECANWFNTNKAMLHPNMLFREPFGLAPVEAQLCGMPVIAWKKGACQETIKDKETGFLVESQAEMEELVKNDAVSTINPKRCREWASQFSYENMVNRYEELCFEALESGGW